MPPLIIYILAIILGAIVFAFFVVAPLIIRFTFRMPAWPELKEISVQQLPEKVLNFFEQNSDPLEREGFTFVTDAIGENFLPDMIAYLRLFVNRESCDMASCVWLYNDIGGGKKIEKNYVEFSSEFSTELEVSTTNSDLPPAFKKFEKKKLFRAPDIRDVHRLYEIHKRETANIDTFSWKILPRKGKELAQFAESISKDLKNQEEAGYLFRDQLNNIYRPTLKGAFLMTYKSIFGIVEKMNQS